MSFRSMMSRDSCSIVRIDPAQNQSSDTGATVKRYTAAARGQLPQSSVPCRIQELSTAEAVRLGLNANVVQYNVFFPDDPGIEIQDRILITVSELDDVLGGTKSVTRTLKPHGKSRNMDSLTSSTGFHVLAVEDDSIQQGDLFP